MVERLSLMVVRFSCGVSKLFLQHRFAQQQPDTLGLAAYAHVTSFVRRFRKARLFANQRHLDSNYAALLV